ncbi:50S ribosomal protein L16 [Candidatus Woesearchaeota archaeon]|nr:50S ribosomal protein L16 [Candidatus Woesearchaeota archaeon]
MAKLRRARTYRKIDRPYTRVSKFRKKSFIRMSPARKVTRFDMGDTFKQFTHILDLVPKDSLQIRQESIESARMTSIRLLEKKLAKNAFHFKILKYPYQILREKSLALGAGADRVSTGMQKPFGKPVGVAVQIRAGERFFTVKVDKPALEVARLALQRASKKMPCSFSIIVYENKAVTPLKEGAVIVAATA